MPKLNHFEIAADDPARASKFYKDAFGWEIKKWDGPMDYWMVMTGKEGPPGIDGGLYKREASDKPGNYRCTITVPNIDNYIEKVKTAGGKIQVEKMAIPGIGYIAWCVDTEGNTFGLMESDMKAK